MFKDKKKIVSGNASWSCDSRDPTRATVDNALQTYRGDKKFFRPVPLSRRIRRVLSDKGKNFYFFFPFQSPE